MSYGGVQLRRMEQISRRKPEQRAGSTEDRIEETYDFEFTPTPPWRVFGRCPQLLGQVDSQSRFRVQRRRGKDERQSYSGGRPSPIDFELRIIRATGGWNTRNSWMVGNPYLGITSGLPVIREQSQILLRCPHQTCQRAVRLTTGAPNDRPRRDDLAGSRVLAAFMRYSLSKSDYLLPGNSLGPTSRTWSVAGLLFCLRAQFGRTNPNLSTYTLGSN